MTGKERKVEILKNELACVRNVDCERSECRNCNLVMPEHDITEALQMAIKALEVEPLTDTEQLIFLAAMSREENACKEVCADGSDGGVDLVAVCHSIERKVKMALCG